MPALAFQFTQMFLLQLRGTDCAWLHGFSKSAQQLCINAIGLGQNSSRSGKLPYPVGLHQTDFDSRSRKRLDQSAFVPSARFTNHLHWCAELLNPLDQLPVTERVVGKTTLLISNRRVQIR